MAMGTDLPRPDWLPAGFPLPNGGSITATAIEADESAAALTIEFTTEDVEAAEAAVVGPIEAAGTATVVIDASVFTAEGTCQVGSDFASFESSTGDSISISLQEDGTGRVNSQVSVTAITEDTTMLWLLTDLPDTERRSPRPTATSTCEACSPISWVSTPRTARRTTSRGRPTHEPMTPGHDTRRRSSCAKHRMRRSPPKPHAGRSATAQLIDTKAGDGTFLCFSAHRFVVSCTGSPVVLALPDYGQSPLR